MADNGHVSVFVFKNLARNVNNSKSTSRSDKTVLLLFDKQSDKIIRLVTKIRLCEPVYRHKSRSKIIANESWFSVCTRPNDVIYTTSISKLG